MKTKEELNALKEEVKTVKEKLSALTEEELEQVTGGSEPRIIIDKPFPDPVIFAGDEDQGIPPHHDYP